MTHHPRLSLAMYMVAALAFTIHPAGYAQPPETVLVQGQLLDNGGGPLAGTRDYRVRFFDAGSGGSQLGGDLTGQVTVSPEGLFAIPLVPSLEVLIAPEAWYELAVDSSVPLDGVDGDDVFPERVRLHSVPFALQAAGLQGEAFVMVQTTSDPVVNGANLQAAYALAAGMTPHGQLRTGTNRAVVLVPPGNYDLGSGQLEMHADHVDLVGLSTARDAQYIYGTSDGAGTGVLRQTASDVRIENLFVHCTLATGVHPGASGPAAYFPDSDRPGTVIRNCRFLANPTYALAMRMGIWYSGHYEDCDANSHAFGGIGGHAFGTFINCDGGDFAFGANGGTASGTFINCTGGTHAFGGEGGTASGVFTNCTGGAQSFGGGGDGVASGVFTNCTGGLRAFGGGVNAVSSGTFTHCTGGQSSFGSGTGAVASGLFEHCTGGPSAFGASGGSAEGGRFLYCNGGLGSFTTEGSPVALYCVRNGVAYP